jgi:hypothetical protein
VGQAISLIAMRRRLKSSETVFKRNVAEAEAEFCAANEHLAACEAAPLSVGGLEVMRARQRWATSATNYHAALTAYGEHLIDPVVSKSR